MNKENKNTKTNKQPKDKVFRKLVRKMFLHFVFVAVLPLLATIVILYVTFNTATTVEMSLVASEYLSFLTWLSIGSVALTFVLLIVVAYSTTNFVVERLRAIKDAADNIANDGEDSNVDPEIQEELEEVYKSFRLVSGFIGDSKNSLNMTISKLENVLEKEKEFSLLKSKFIRVISHQLRSPLSGIRWGIELLMKEKIDFNPEQEDTVKQMYQSSVRLISTLDDMLTVLDIEKKKIPFKFEKINVCEVISKIVKDCEYECLTRNVLIHVEGCKDSAGKVLLCHERTLSKLLRILLDNAIFYSKKGGDVNLRVDFSENVVKFEVEDKGIGIPKKELKEIGTRFYRASNADIALPNGSGVGIYIVKNIVDIYGGEFGFDSKLGKGSKFYFSLPLVSKENNQTKNDADNMV